MKENILQGTPPLATLQVNWGEIWAEAKRMRSAECGMWKGREENAKSHCVDAGV